MDSVIERRRERIGSKDASVVTFEDIVNSNAEIEVKVELLTEFTMLTRKGKNQ